MSLIYFRTNQFKFCEKSLFLIYYSLLNHEGFKHGMFFCANRHELGVVDKEMKGVTLAIPPFFSQQRQTQLQPVSYQEPHHASNVHATCEHYSSTSLKVQSCSAVKHISHINVVHVFPHLKALAHVIAPEFQQAAFLLKSCAQNHSSTSSRDGTRR